MMEGEPLIELPDEKVLFTRILESVRSPELVASERNKVTGKKNVAHVVVARATHVEVLDAGEARGLGVRAMYELLVQVGLNHLIPPDELVLSR